MSQDHAIAVGCCYALIFRFPGQSRGVDIDGHAVDISKMYPRLHALSGSHANERNRLADLDEESLRFCIGNTKGEVRQQSHIHLIDILDADLPRR